VAVPSLAPLHVTWVVELIQSVRLEEVGAGSVMVMDFVSEQPLESFTEYEYVPAFTFVIGPVKV
jgi:hypothetical protein